MPFNLSECVTAAENLQVRGLHVQARNLLLDTYQATANSLTAAQAEDLLSALSRVGRNLHKGIKIESSLEYFFGRPNMPQEYPFALQGARDRGYDGLALPAHIFSLLNASLLGPLDSQESALVSELLSTPHNRAEFTGLSVEGGERKLIFYEQPSLTYDDIPLQVGFCGGYTFSDSLPKFTCKRIFELSRELTGNPTIAELAELNPFIVPYLWGQRFEDLHLKVKDTAYLVQQPDIIMPLSRGHHSVNPKQQMAYSLLGGSRARPSRGEKVLR